MKVVMALALSVGCSGFRFSGRPFTPPSARRAAAAAAEPMAEPTAAVVEVGDYVRLRWSATRAEDGAPLFPAAGSAAGSAAAPLFDQGEVALVVGGGGFLPGLHAALVGLEAPAAETAETAAETATETKAQVVTTIAPEQAFGAANPDLGPVDLPLSAAPEGIAPGMLVQLANGLKCRVTAVHREDGGGGNEGTVTIDANSELAGATVRAEVQVLAVDKGGASLEAAHFALGCFWGAELAFQREPGVVATAVGYTQGAVEAPSYEAVCSGSTGHTEAVQVRFDPRLTSYGRLLDLFWERLGESRYLLNQVGNDRGTQYRHGVYWHNEAQRAAAAASLEAAQAEGLVAQGGTVYTELQEAAHFWPAEEYHQQYLQKGGQSAQKKASETIRCYG